MHPFHSLLLRASLLLSFPAATKMLQFTAYASFLRRISCEMFHIRKSLDQCLHAAPQSLSQLATSFFAAQTKLFTWQLVRIFMRYVASYEYQRRQMCLAHSRHIFHNELVNMILWFSKWCKAEKRGTHQRLNPIPLPCLKMYAGAALYQMNYGPTLFSLLDYFYIFCWAVAASLVCNRQYICQSETTGSW